MIIEKERIVGYGLFVTALYPRNILNTQKKVGIYGYLEYNEVNQNPIIYFRRLR